MKASATYPQIDAETSFSPLLIENLSYFYKEVWLG
jgi:hypothetical protein